MLLSHWPTFGVRTSRTPDPRDEGNSLTVSVVSHHLSVKRSGNGDRLGRGSFAARLWECSRCSSSSACGRTHKGDHEYGKGLHCIDAWRSFARLFFDTQMVSSGRLRLRDNQRIIVILYSPFKTLISPFRNSFYFRLAENLPVQEAHLCSIVWGGTTDEHSSFKP